MAAILPTLRKTFALCKPNPGFLPPAYMSRHFNRFLRPKINCYTWALTAPGMGLGIPGSLIRQTEEYIETYDVPTLRKLVLQDGLVEISSREAFDAANHAIALRIHANEDFHFYVRCADGTWSHKPGQRSPGIRDALGAVIQNPETIKDPKYTVFGGYFAIPLNGIEYFIRLRSSVNYDLSEGNSLPQYTATLG